ncbi:hypothetical protein MMC15_008678 [Xylographa vitiligo]|nr:hypothetical protein [Xylographa vitiligo]
MPLSDPVDSSIIVEFDPFEDKTSQTVLQSPPPPMAEVRKTSDSDLSSSPETPMSGGDGPHFKHYEQRWDQFDGTIYSNVESQYKGAFGTSDNHYAATAVKPGAAELARSKGPPPTMGMIRTRSGFQELVETHAVNGDYDPLTVCGDCIAHQKAATLHTDIEHRADAIHQFSNDVIDKVVALEKELGVTIVHLVHEGTSWIRRGHHHGIGDGKQDGKHDGKQESKPDSIEPENGGALQRDLPVHGQ